MEEASQRDLAEQEEELQVLSSIYGDDIVIDNERHSCTLALWHPEDAVGYGGESSSREEADAPLHLSIHLPADYPSSSAPFAEIIGMREESMRVKAIEELEQLWRDGGGMVLLFSWIEWLKNDPDTWEGIPPLRAVTGTSVATHPPAHGAEDGEKKKGREQDEEGEGEGEDEEEYDDYGGGGGGDEAGNDYGAKAAFRMRKSAESGVSAEKAHVQRVVASIIHGDPIVERRSTFQAHVAPVKSVEEVLIVMDELLSNRKIASATHNIMAYRIHLPERQTYAQDCDDDGETAAGARLLHLLQVTDATDVVVVVSRWFGGILLGPDRFKWINNTARNLLQQTGFLKQTTTGGGKKR